MSERQEIWDEFRWEELMRKQEKRLDRCMELFYRDRGEPRRDDILQRLLESQWMDGAIGLDDGYPDVEYDESQDGEGWKSIAAVKEEQESGHSVAGYSPAYRRAVAFAMGAFRFAERLPDWKSNNSSVVDFVSNAMIAAAKLAGGSAMGDDIDELGGNIAFCKRSLAAANFTIAALHEMKEKGIVSKNAYRELQEEATEVRNAIAVHILDLREKFRRGISTTS